MKTATKLTQTQIGILRKMEECYGLAHIPRHSTARVLCMAGLVTPIQGSRTARTKYGEPMQTVYLITEAGRAAAA